MIEKEVKMEILAVRPVNKGFVKCSVDVSIQTRVGEKEVPFIIRRISVFEKEGQSWISLPSEKYEKDGKKQFYAYALFKDPAHQKDFQNELLTILNKSNAGSQKAPAKRQIEYEQDDLPF